MGAFGAVVSSFASVCGANVANSEQKEYGVMVVLAMYGLCEQDDGEVVEAERKGAALLTTTGHIGGALLDALAVANRLCSVRDGDVRTVSDLSRDQVALALFNAHIIAEAADTIAAALADLEATLTTPC